jgi:hypothetical protein
MDSLSKPAKSGAAPRRGRTSKTEAITAAPPSLAPEMVEVIERYFDAEGRPIKRKSLGAARVARRYDQRGNQVEEAYYNPCGKPTPRRGLGAARIQWRYDADGRKVEAEFFGPDGDLLSREAAGVALERRDTTGTAG